MKSNCCKANIVLLENPDNVLLITRTLCGRCAMPCEPAIRKTFSRPSNVHTNKKKEVTKFNKREIWFD